MDTFVREWGSPRWPHQCTLNLSHSQRKCKQNLKFILVFLVTCLLEPSGARIDKFQLKDEVPSLHSHSTVPSRNYNTWISSEGRPPDQNPLVSSELLKRGIASSSNIKIKHPFSVNGSLVSRISTLQLGHSRRLMAVTPGDHNRPPDIKGIAELPLHKLMSVEGQQLVPADDQSGLPKERVSRVKKLGETWFHFENVCLQPNSQEWLHFYSSSKQESDEVSPVPRVELCNEFPDCQNYYYKLVPSPAPRPVTGPFHGTSEQQLAAEEETKGTAANEGARWFLKQEAVAVVEPFTSLSGWHLLHHLMPTSQLLSAERESIGAATVHLHPTFALRGFGKTYKPLDASCNASFFSEAGAPFWPLLAAVPPPGMKALQINLLEPNPAGAPSTGAKEADTSESENPTIPVCYESLYLGSPRMLTYKSREEGSGEWRWEEMKGQAINAFRERVVSLAGAENLRSGFCPASGTSLEDSGKLSTSALAGLTGVLQRGWEKAHQLWGSQKEHRLAPLAVIVVRNNTYRRILNLEQVKTEVQRQGFRFQEVLWETMSIWEQVRRARTADVMIGAHGNGLTNMLWMRPQTALVEIFPRMRGGEGWLKPGLNTSPRSNFGSFAGVAKVQHYAVEAEWRQANASDNWEEMVHWQRWRSVNLVVEVQELGKILQEVRLSMDSQLPCT